MEKLNSIDDIDNMLDAQYGVVPEEGSTQDVNLEENASNENQDASVQEKPTEVEGNLEPSTDESEPATPVVESQEPKIDTKPSKEDQKAYSFKALRQERDNYKKQSEEFASDNNFLKELASSYGYTDVSEFKKAVKVSTNNKVAESKGIDPVLYNQMVEQSERIRELETRDRERELNYKAEKFNNEVDNIVKEYNLGEDGASIVFKRLAESGYTEINQILDLPDSKPLLRGLLSDYAKASVEQKQIKNLEKAKSLSDNPSNDSGTKTTISLDDLIAQEIKQYKADNFIN